MGCWASGLPDLPQPCRTGRRQHVQEGRSRDSTSPTLDTPLGCSPAAGSPDTELIPSAPALRLERLWVTRSGKLHHTRKMKQKDTKAGLAASLLSFPDLFAKLQ